MTECELLLQQFGRTLLGKKSDNTALLDALVGYGDAVDEGQFLTQGAGHQPDSFADGFESPSKGIIDCYAEGELTWSAIAHKPYRALCLPLSANGTEVDKFLISFNFPNWTEVDDLTEDQPVQHRP